MRKVLPTFLFVLTILWSCQSEPVVSVAEQTKENDGAFIQGTVNILVSEEMAESLEADLQTGLETRSSQLNSLIRDYGVISISRMFPDAGEFEPRHREAGLHRWYKINYDPSVSLTKAGESFGAIPGVCEVDIPRKIKEDSVWPYNDTFMSNQWYLFNDGKTNGNFVYGADINVLPVWREFTSGSSEVIVAVIDSGIDMEHEDLAAAVLPGGPKGSKNFVRGNYSIVAGKHGTHVAGLVAAVGNNGKGICGVAGGSTGTGGVRLMSCETSETNADGTSDGGSASEAMVWAADNGAVISQNSWGYVYKTEDDAKNSTSPSYIKTAIDYFIKNAGVDANGNQTGPMKGGVVLFSAGNSNWGYAHPCDYESVIGVAATGPSNLKASYSNYGDWVDICAPGGDSGLGGQIYSTIPGNQYAYLNGTSMACPIVSGVAALLVSYYGGPGFTCDMLKTKLLKGANAEATAGSVNPIGPLVDAYGAFTQGGTFPPEKVTNLNAYGSGNSAIMEWTVTSDPDNKKAYGYVLAAAKTKAELENIDIRHPAAGIKTSIVLVGEKNVGDRIAGSVQDLEFESDYFVTIAGYDYPKNFSEKSEIKSIKTTRNNAPLIETDYTGDFHVKAYQTLIVDFNLSDPDMNPFTSRFECASRAAKGEFFPETSIMRVTFTGTEDVAGDYTATITVTDNYEGTTKKQINFKILENSAPVVIKEAETLLMTGIGQTLELNISDYLTDPDEEELTYTFANSDKTTLNTALDGTILTLTALSYGKATVTVTARDAKNASCTLPITVVIRNPTADIDIYPNPVKDYLYIGYGTGSSIKVTITTSNGKEILNWSGNSSIVKPLSLQMKGCAPGVYNVKVETKDKEFKKQIVKL